MGKSSDFKLETDVVLNDHVFGGSTSSLSDEYEISSMSVRVCVFSSPKDAKVLVSYKPAPMCSRLFKHPGFKLADF